MPIQHAIWRVAPQPVRLIAAGLGSEAQLEEMILAEPAILSPEWMIIGRQEQTGFGGRIDLLAVAPDASLVLIELKRNRTPREVVAQALDYASWVDGLTAERIAEIFRRFSGGGSLAKAFEAKFGSKLDEESLNASHQVILVASELDGPTERIIAYLNARDIAINVMFFQVFQLNGEKLLSRAWLLDPGETQANASVLVASKGEKEPWNGEYYVSFGDGESRSWEDAMRFGFISAGGGSWYSQTLRLLSPGDRVWVRIPQVGYVGVGIVVAPVVPASECVFSVDGREASAIDLLSHGHLYARSADDPETAEYMVQVRWLDVVPRAKAFSEVGLFGNQNSVCRPATPKWRHTVDRLKQRFSNWQQDSET